MKLICAAIFFVQLLVLSVATGYCIREQSRGAALVGAILTLLNVAGFVIEVHALVMGPVRS